MFFLLTFLFDADIFSDILFEVTDIISGFVEKEPHNCA